MRLLFTVGWSVALICCGYSCRAEVGGIRVIDACDPHAVREFSRSFAICATADGGVELKATVKN